MKALGSVLLVGGIYFVCGFGITAGMAVGLKVAEKLFVEKKTEETA